MQARAIEIWASKFVVNGSGWQKECFAFEYVSIERGSWAATGWRHGVVTSSVRRGMNEGYVVEIRVDGLTIIRAKCLVYGKEECTVVAAHLVRAYQKRIDVVMRRNAAATELEDRKWAEIMGTYVYVALGTFPSVEAALARCTEYGALVLQSCDVFMRGSAAPYGLTEHTPVAASTVGVKPFHWPRRT